MNPSRYRWQTELDLVVNEQLWRDIYKICFNTVKDNYLIWMQYKILQRILGCKYYMYRIKITNDSTCSLCTENSETMVDLFYIVKYQERAESLYNMQMQVALRNFKEEEFNKQWNKWGTLFYP